MKFKEIFQRIKWMFKVQNCKGICLFCPYYEECKCDLMGQVTTLSPKNGRQKNEFEILVKCWKTLFG